VANKKDDDDNPFTGFKNKTNKQTKNKTLPLNENSSLR